VTSVAGAPLFHVDEDALARRELDAVTRRRHRTSALVAWWRFFVLALLIAAWYLASGRLVSGLFVSDPWKVARAFGHELNNGLLLRNARVTLEEALLGYAIGAAAALACAALLSLSYALHRVVRPFLMAFYAIPKVALAPLMIMWFGLLEKPKVILAGVFVFFVVLMSTLAGLQSVGRNVVDVARVMGARRHQILLKIVFPTAIPTIVTALRIAIPGAMAGAIIGEFMSSNAGLGYLVQSASAQFATAQMFAGIAAILILVLLLDGLLALVERSLLAWRPGALQAVGG
jgi:NitT/TauT family transport system permease protein